MNDVKRKYGKRTRPISIDGALAYVPLTKGYVAVIDAADVGLVEGFNWCALLTRGKVYAARADCSGPKQRTVRLHRVIMSAPPGLEVDHIDGDSLNNRRANLRIVTHAENSRNQRISPKSKSGVKGVCHNKATGKWQAQIKLHGKKYHLGHFTDIKEAQAAYAFASKKLHGEFGRTS